MLCGGPISAPSAVDHAAGGGSMTVSEKYTRPANSPNEPIRTSSIKMIRSICHVPCNAYIAGIKVPASARARDAQGER